MDPEDLCSNLQACLVDSLELPAALIRRRSTADLLSV
jgi:hypothetical protein